MQKTKKKDDDDEEKSPERPVVHIPQPKKIE